VIDTSEFRNGLKILIDNEPFVIVEFQHVKPGKGLGVRAHPLQEPDQRPHAGEETSSPARRWAVPTSKRRRCSISSRKATTTSSMDSKNYEQSHIDQAGLGESEEFPQENMDASVLFWNGRAISVDLPNAVELKVVKCDSRRARRYRVGRDETGTLETGYTLQVRSSINEGDILKIDTRTGEYLTRVG